MALFASRPEEPTEWAGLPAEPLPERPAAESLPESPDLDHLGGVLGVVGGQSIVIPVFSPPPTSDHDGAPGDVSGSDRG